MTISIIRLDDGSCARVAEDAEEAVTRATSGDRWLYFTDPIDGTAIWVCTRRMVQVVQADI